MQENMQQNSGPVTHYLFAALSFHRFSQVYGEKNVHILLSDFESTGYHSYMSHNNNAFCNFDRWGTLTPFSFQHFLLNVTGSSNYFDW